MRAYIINVFKTKLFLIFNIDSLTLSFKVTLIFMWHFIGFRGFVPPSLGSLMNQYVGHHHFQVICIYLSIPNILKKKKKVGDLKMYEKLIRN